MVNQKIVEDGEMRTLKEFADSAVIYLIEHSECDEVVQLADHIVELKHDAMTPPGLIYCLPRGYDYNFSGFSGQVVGVGLTSIRELHKAIGRR